MEVADGSTPLRTFVWSDNPLACAVDLSGAPAALRDGIGGQKAKVLRKILFDRTRKRSYGSSEGGKRLLMLVARSSAPALPQRRSWAARASLKILELRHLYLRGAATRSAQVVATPTLRWRLCCPQLPPYSKCAYFAVGDARDTQLYGASRATLRAPCYR